MTAQADTERPLRADARRNRECLLEAARDCFAEAGVDAQMDDVARRAKLGVGTLYRHFPDKTALLQALADERFRELTELARAALEEDDPWESFRAFLWSSAELQARDLGLCQVMAALPATVKAAAPSAADLNAAVSALIARGQRAGAIRADLRPDDVPLIMCGIGRALQATAGGDEAPSAWQRHLTLMLDGMRAPGTSPLPG